MFRMYVYKRQSCLMTFAKVTKQQMHTEHNRNAVDR